MSVLYGLVTCIVIILPFSFNQKPLWIFELFFNTSEGYKYASLNAFNFFSLIGKNLVSDSEIFFIFSYNTWGYIFLVLICFGITPLLYFKSKNSSIVYLASLIQATGLLFLDKNARKVHVSCCCPGTTCFYLYQRHKVNGYFCPVLFYCIC